MTSSVAHICKEVIPLIPSKCKAMKYITLLFPKVLRRRLWFMFWNSSGSVFEFLVTDGDILNFWRFKAMNIGFYKYNGSCRTCTGHIPSLCWLTWSNWLSFVSILSTPEIKKAIANGFRYLYLITKLNSRHVKEMIRCRIQDQAQNEKWFTFKTKSRGN